MNIADNVLKRSLRNVYFIWGSGRTTAANILAEKYGLYVYHTDDERSLHIRNASSAYQPAMCRTVSDYTALEREDVDKWEQDIIREYTSMVVIDLIEMATKHDIIICEGDIDIDQIMPVVTNAVTISNYSDTATGQRIPAETEKFGVKQIIRTDDISAEETALKIADYFGFKAK